MNPDSTLAVTQTCPKDGVHLWLPRVAFVDSLDKLLEIDVVRYSHDHCSLVGKTSTNTTACFCILSFVDRRLTRCAFARQTRFRQT